MADVRSEDRRESLVRRRLRRDPAVLLGAAILLVMVCAALAAPVLPLPHPDAVQLRLRLQSPGAQPGHLLGTDEFGRDMLSRIVWGARISLLAGIVTAAGSMAVGLPLGLAAGYLGSRADHAIMRATEVVMAFPFLLLAIAVVAGLGPGMVNAMIAVSFAGFPLYARLSRGLALGLRRKEFVEAAQAIGGTDVWIIGRHVLPNVLGPAIVTFSLDIGSKVIATASLSFLGLGVQPPTADWGSILSTGREFVTTAPHVALLPGLAIALTVLGANLLGDGLRDALDPTVV